MSEVEKAIDDAVKHSDQFSNLYTLIHCVSVQSVEGDGNFDFGSVSSDFSEFSTSSSEHTRESADVEDLIDRLKESATLFQFLKFTLVNENINLSDVSLIFREETVGTAVLRDLWFQQEGALVLSELIEPLVQKIMSLPNALEIDPNRTRKGLKTNLNKLVQLLSQFIQDFTARFHELISKEFVDLVQHIQSSLSQKFPDINIGSLLVLRLISPAIVSPYQYLQSQVENNVPLHTQRTLILFAKVLQRLANHTVFEDALEAYMNPTNAFITKTLPSWKAYFIALFTKTDGAEPMEDEQTQIHTKAIEQTNHVDELTCRLLMRSALNIHPSTKDRCVSTLVTLSEDVKSMLYVDERTDFNQIDKKTFDIFWKIVPQSSSIVVKAQSRPFRSNFKKVFEYIRDYSNTAVFNPAVEDLILIERLSTNLSIEMQTLKMGFSRREVIMTKYSESVPESRFAVVSLKTAVRDDIPNKYPRAPIFATFFIRENEKGELIVTYITEIEFIGLFHLVPNSILRATLKKHLSWFEKTLNSLELL